jgi:hypothetical protein
MRGLSTLRQIIVDICTVKNGQDACIAGIAMFIGIISGLLIVIYALVVSPVHDLPLIGGLLKDFGTYQGVVITTGCAGKAIKQNAEPA